MPRKGRKGGRSDACIIPFHISLSGALSAGLFSFNLNPSAINRLLIEADAWAFFRVRSFSFRLLPTSPSTVAQAAGFVGGIQDTPPATYLQVSELLPSCVKGVGQTTPTMWVRVAKSELSGPLPWYKTIPGTADPTEEAPGSVIVVGTGTETYNIEMKGKFEFKTSVNSGNTPLSADLRARIREERALLYKQREREILLRILSTTAAQKMLP